MRETEREGGVGRGGRDDGDRWREVYNFTFVNQGAGEELCHNRFTHHLENAATNLFLWSMKHLPRIFSRSPIHNVRSCT
jgi:hypothetical protein